MTEEVTPVEAPAEVKMVTLVSARHHFDAPTGERKVFATVSAPDGSTEEVEMTPAKFSYLELMRSVSADFLVTDVEDYRFPKTEHVPFVPEELQVPKVPVEEVPAKGKAKKVAAPEASITVEDDTLVQPNAAQ